eukprot:gnl/TRDRNA2_/TRDRNA2_179248_c0_seq1.p1 gnl/TRDRNA2_/TRDRNA2_179248_c0~~gnl/TRDRNA2_/TRDRNA2_179248_c0_seq1.p1  ORF type:complete len:147 (-),score=36.67 gnl/TRDRNA2_/TRDRNA2_179248_c0_seq1:100-540(-)
MALQSALRWKLCGLLLAVIVAPTSAQLAHEAAADAVNLLQDTVTISRRADGTDDTDATPVQPEVSEEEMIGLFQKEIRKMEQDVKTKKRLLRGMRGDSEYSPYTNNYYDYDNGYRGYNNRYYNDYDDDYRGYDYNREPEVQVQNFI